MCDEWSRKCENMPVMEAGPAVEEWGLVFLA